MKKIYIVITVVLIFVLIFAFFMIYLDYSEWMIRTKKYESKIPLNTNVDSILKIETQVGNEVKKLYNNSYLEEIIWKADTKDEFIQNKGKLIFLYCENLGDANGYYKCERYAHIRVTVNLTDKIISEFEIYGNYQLMGRAKFEKVLDFDNIKLMINEFLVKEYSKEKCEVIESNVILRQNDSYLNFKIQSGSENAKKIYGNILINDNEKLFIQSAKTF